LTLDAPDAQKFRNLFLFGYGDEKGLRGAGSLGDIDAEKTILISGLGLSEVIAGGDFDDTLERPVVDFHDEEFAFSSAAAIRSLAADHETIAFDGQLQVFAAHAREFDLDDEGALGDVNVSVGDPVCFAGGFEASAHLFAEVE
jgi:hypothetical protein